MVSNPGFSQMSSSIQLFRGNPRSGIIRARINPWTSTWTSNRQAFGQALGKHSGKRLAQDLADSPVHTHTSSQRSESAYKTKNNDHSLKNKATNQVAFKDTYA